MGKNFYSSGETIKVNQDFADAIQEARILAKFDHKNIVAVFWAKIWDKRSFIIILDSQPLLGARGKKILFFNFYFSIFFSKNFRFFFKK